MGALHYAAATLGWSVELQADWSDEDIAGLLGLDRNYDFKPLEHEFPDLICRINTQPIFNTNTDNCIISTPPQREGLKKCTNSGLSSHYNNKLLDTKILLEHAQSGTWSGKANSLHAYHLYKWPIIDEVAFAASKPRTEKSDWQSARQQIIKSTCTKTATAIIRQRRSVQQFEGKIPPIPQTDFYRMLAAVLPTTAALEFWHWPPKIHLFIFIHRVEDLPSGLYALPRDQNNLEKLQAATLADFDWQRIADAIPLYHLYSGDCRVQAKMLSCHQPIASHSVC